jgi:hypothetical protein
VAAGQEDKWAALREAQRRRARLTVLHEAFATLTAHVSSIRLALSCVGLDTTTDHRRGLDMLIHLVHACVA